MFGGECCWLMVVEGGWLSVMVGGGVVPVSLLVDNSKVITFRD